MELIDFLHGYHKMCDYYEMDCCKNEYDVCPLRDIDCDFMDSNLSDNQVKDIEKLVQEWNAKHRQTNMDKLKELVKENFGIVPECAIVFENDGVYFDFGYADSEYINAKKVD